RVAELQACAPEDGGLRIGAMVRHRALERGLAGERAPLLGLVAPHIGHPQIRTRGTLGGSLAHADPAAELPAAVIALDGEIEVRSRRGSRTVPAEQFFVSFFTTVLEADELLVAVRIPAQPDGTGFGFEEAAVRPGDFALAGAAAAVTVGVDGSIERARIACLAAGSTPLRLHEVEEALLGHRPSDALWHDAEARTRERVEPPEDVHASAGYRRRVAGVLVRRALARAVPERAAA
ncbi:MAG: FAD binding domain-containing protein, partial [bacterium]|nr:FAD binding domain-containing protein [bacterium]